MLNMLLLYIAYAALSLVCVFFPLLLLLGMVLHHDKHILDWTGRFNWFIRELGFNSVWLMPLTGFSDEPVRIVTNCGNPETWKLKKLGNWCGVFFFPEKSKLIFKFIPPVCLKSI